MASDALIGTPIESLQQIGNAADEEAKGTQKGFEVGYELFSINGRMLAPARIAEAQKLASEWKSKQ